ncbi:hypothetical protein Hanom_Chr02g00100221 [Helianthus anomalus]
MVASIQGITELVTTEMQSDATRSNYRCFLFRYDLLYSVAKGQGWSHCSSRSGYGLFSLAIECHSNFVREAHTEKEIMAYRFYSYFCFYFLYYCWEF